MVVHERPPSVYTGSIRSAGLQPSTERSVSGGPAYRTRPITIPRVKVEIMLGNKKTQPDASVVCP